MTRIYPGDLLRISANGRFYYSVVLDKIRLFGGQLCFAFYQTSDTPMEAGEVMRGPYEGFYEIVDFIWAKRENRITRIATKLDVEPLNRKVRLFKNAHPTKEKAKDWWFYDRECREIQRVQKLTEQEKRYPLFRCINDTFMVRLVDQRWSPEQDHRI